MSETYVEDNSPAVRPADTPLFMDAGCGPFGWVEAVRSMTLSQVACNGHIYRAIAPEGYPSVIYGQRNRSNVWGTAFDHVNKAAHFISEFGGGTFDPQLYRHGLPCIPMPSRVEVI